MVSRAIMISMEDKWKGTNKIEEKSTSVQADGVEGNDQVERWAVPKPRDMSPTDMRVISDSDSATRQGGVNDVGSENENENEYEKEKREAIKWVEICGTVSLGASIFIIVAVLRATSSIMQFFITLMLPIPVGGCILSAVVTLINVLKFNLRFSVWIAMVLIGILTCAILFIYVFI